MNQRIEPKKYYYIARADYWPIIEKFGITDSECQIILFDTDKDLDIAAIRDFGLNEYCLFEVHPGCLGGAIDPLREHRFLLHQGKIDPTFIEFICIKSVLKTNKED